MVLGVCRRAVRDAHLAEDAFQAVFLVLARNPASAEAAGSIGGWLFGVARRVGLAARRQELRREKRQQRAAVRPIVPPTPDWDEMMRVMDEELAALSEEFRDPLIACYLREQTQDDAARELGWSLSTLRRRLERGKELLRARLGRRGVTLSVGLFAGILAPSAASAVPPQLVATVARTGAPVAPLVHTLAVAGARHTLLTKLIAVVGAVVLGGVGVGIGWSGESTAEPPQPSQIVGLPANARLTIESPVLAPIPRSDWVTVTGQVVFPEGREIPTPRELKRDEVKDADSCFAGGRRLFDERVRIDAKSRGLANAVVWLRPDTIDRKALFPPEKIHPTLRGHKPKEHRIDIAAFQFTPRVTVAQPGDTLRFDNLCPVPIALSYYDNMHIQNISSKRDFQVLLAATAPPYRPGEALAITPGADSIDSIDSIEDPIHRWIQGFVRTFDHPYAAVTDAEGRFSIPSAPVGKWRLMVWHEKSGWRNGKAGRLGEIVTIPDRVGSTVDLGKLPLVSDGWDTTR